MAGEIGPPRPYPELATLDTARLREMLAEQARLTAEHLLRLAWIVRTLEERGEDLSGLKVGLLPYLRQIAWGQVLPEAVVRFSATPLLLQRVAALPEPDQRSLAAGEPVKLVVPGPEGEGYTHRLLDPAALGRDQIAQVFARGQIRSESEQIAVLEARRLKPASPRGATARGKARADRARGGLTIGRAFVPQADVVAALADLRGDEAAPEGGRSPLVVHLGEEEHRRLKVAAARGDTTMSELARSALRAAGLI